jgi:hypothetical protein
VSAACLATVSDVLGAGDEVMLFSTQAHVMDACNGIAQLKTTLHIQQEQVSLSAGHP